jgi:hypothetical protein
MQAHTKALLILVGCVFIGIFSGVAATELQPAMAAVLGGLLAFVCGFFGALGGISVMGVRHQQEIVALLKEQKQLKVLLRRKMGHVGTLLTSTSEAVATRVAIRMVDELFKNADSDEHRDAAVHRGGQIVSEEVVELVKSIEDAKC